MFSFNLSFFFLITRLVILLPSWLPLEVSGCWYQSSHLIGLPFQRAIELVSSLLSAFIWLGTIESRQVLM